MYFVKYGDDYLHDPRVDDNEKLYDISLDCEENSCGYCDFTIYPSNPLYDKIKERDVNKEIVVLDDNDEIFRGFVYELGKEFYLNGQVRCKGQLAYLEESIVRPYSTYSRGYGNVIDGSPRSVFEYLIEQHNQQVNSNNKRFKMGNNQAMSLSKSSKMLIESDDCPNTITEISNRFINDEGLKGVLRIRNEKDGRYIDLLKEWTDVNSQILDFGVNLTDYASIEDSSSIATYIVPFGAQLQETEYEYNDGYFKTQDTIPQNGKTYYNKTESSYTQCVGLTMFTSGVDYYEYDYSKDQSTERLTIKDYGPYSPPSGIDIRIVPTMDGYKFRKDMIYNEDAVKKYGYIGMVYDNSSILTRQELVEAATIELAKNISPKTTIEIKAVDMHMLFPDVKSIKIGEYVRVRSAPHKLDSYFLCTNIVLDLNNPENSIYTLGTTFDTLTGQQNKIINKLNSKINKSLDAASSIVTIDATAKNAFAAVNNLAIEQVEKLANLKTTLEESTDNKIESAMVNVNKNITSTIQSALDSYEVGGINLLKREHCSLGTVSRTENGITISSMGRNGWFTVSGNTIRQNQQFPVPLWYNGGNFSGDRLPNKPGTYTLTVETGGSATILPFVASNRSTEQTINLKIYCSDGTYFMFYPNLTNKYITFTTQGYIYRIDFYMGMSIKAGTSVNGKFRLMLEHGSKSSGYQPPIDDLTSEIADAYKYATDYISFAENVGLIVGDMRNNGTLNHNSLMNSAGFHVRKGDTIRASYTDTGIKFYNKNGDKLRMIITDDAIQMNNGQGEQKAIFSDNAIKMDGFYTYKGATDGRRRVKIGHFDETDDEASYVMIDDDSVDIRCVKQLFSRFDKTGMIVKDVSDSSDSKGNLLELTSNNVVIGSKKKGHTTLDGETLAMRSGTESASGNHLYFSAGKISETQNGIRLYSSPLGDETAKTALDVYNTTKILLVPTRKIQNDITVSFLDNLTLISENSGSINLDSRMVYVTGDMTVNGTFNNPLLHKNDVNLGSIRPVSESYHVSTGYGATGLPSGLTSAIRDARSFQGSNTTLMADFLYGWNGRIYYSTGKVTSDGDTSKSQFLEIPQCVDLFDDSTNASNNILLNDSAARYSKLTVVYRSSISPAYCSTDITNPDGKLVNLQTMYFSQNENMNIYSGQYLISGKNIKVRVSDNGKTLCGAAAINDNGTTSSGENENAIYIVKVIGWL